jgi:hypothetical protein
MLNRYFPLLFVIIFLMAAVPLLLLYPSGAARTGMSVGFMFYLNQPLYVSLVMMVALIGCAFPRDEIVLLPISFVLMFSIGTLVHIDHTLYTLLDEFTLGAILLYAFTVNICQSRGFLLATVVVSSLAYHMGAFTMQTDIGDNSPLYILIGETIFLVLVLCSTASLGYALRGELPFIYGIKETSTAANE